MSVGVRRQVLAILESNGLTWSGVDDGYALRFASAMLLLRFAAVGEQTVILLRAPVLREVPAETRGEALLQRLNEFNCASHFAKWVLYEDEALVMLEYDLLGDYLQENELMTALTSLARLADQQDDVLQAEFGGVRAYESP